MWTCITTVWLIVLLTYTYVYTFFMRGHFSNITYVTSDAFHVRRNLCHAVLPWLDDQPTTHTLSAAMFILSKKTHTQPLVKLCI